MLSGFFAAGVSLKRSGHFNISIIENLRLTLGAGDDDTAKAVELYCDDDNGCEWL